MIIFVTFLKKNALVVFIPFLLQNYPVTDHPQFFSKQAKTLPHFPRARASVPYILRSMLLRSGMSRQRGAREPDFGRKHKKIQEISQSIAS